MVTEMSSAWTKHFDFLLLDIICVELSLLFACIVRTGSVVIFFTEHYRLLSLMLISVQVFISFFFGIYHQIIKRGFLQEMKNVIINVILIFGFEMLLMFALQISEHYSRVAILLSALINVVLQFIVHIVWKKHLQVRNQKKDHYRHTLLITSRNYVTELLHQWQAENDLNYRVVGLILIDRQGETEIAGLPVVGGENDLYEYARTNVVDDVFLYHLNGTTQTLIDQFTDMGIVAHVILHQFTNDKLKYRIDTVNQFQTITAGIGTMTLSQTVLKRALDICIGLIGSAVTLLLLLFVTPIIKLQSQGPIFFKQKRMGKNGRIFDLYKFRSMYTDAEERKKELMNQNKMDGFMFKMDNDPRIFPFGAVMRKFSIDEFPQFFNVLKGDMTFCGTRPPTVDEYEQYQLHHKSRLAMKPGITGLWQVSGRSDITDFEEIVRLDNEYIRNWSLELDIKIMCKTVLVVFAHKGAA